MRNKAIITLGIASLVLLFSISFVGAQLSPAGTIGGAVNMQPNIPPPELFPTPMPIVDPTIPGNGGRAISKFPPWASLVVVSNSGNVTLRGALSNRIPPQIKTLGCTWTINLLPETKISKTGQRQPTSIESFSVGDVVLVIGKIKFSEDCKIDARVFRGM